MSAKDIYEAKVYAANMYAAGVFRGVGTATSTLVGRWSNVSKIDIHTEQRTIDVHTESRYIDE